MDAGQLERCIEENVDALSFEEALIAPGASSTFPSRRVAPPAFAPAELSGVRLNVLVRRAALASCAIFGVFPAVMLEAKDFKGIVVPYMPNDKCGRYSQQ